MKRSLRTFVTKNWALKLASLVLALVIWLLLIPEDKVYSDKSLVVPLELRNIPVGLELIERNTSTIEVAIRGPNRLLKEVGAQNIRAVLDLEKATVYQQEFPLNPNMISVPSGVRLIAVRPNKVNIKLERTREETLMIKPTVRGRPADGFRLEGVEVQPAKVLVSGPESRFRSKDVVTTTPIDITGLDKQTVFDVDIILPHPELRLLSIFTTVRVTVKIAEARPGAAAANSKARKN